VEKKTCFLSGFELIEFEGSSITFSYENNNNNLVSKHYLIIKPLIHLPERPKLSSSNPKHGR
jgi:hypothetical protein